MWARMWVIYMYNLSLRSKGGDTVKNKRRSVEENVGLNARHQSETLSEGGHRWVVG